MCMIHTCSSICQNHFCRVNIGFFLVQQSFITLTRIILPHIKNKWSVRPTYFPLIVMNTVAASIAPSAKLVKITPINHLLSHLHIHQLHTKLSRLRQSLKLSTALNHFPTLPHNTTFPQFHPACNPLPADNLCPHCKNPYRTPPLSAPLHIPYCY